MLQRFQSQKNTWGLWLSWIWRLKCHWTSLFNLFLLSVYLLLFSFFANPVLLLLPPKWVEAWPLRLTFWVYMLKHSCRLKIVRPSTLRMNNKILKTNICVNGCDAAPITLKRQLKLKEKCGPRQLISTTKIETIIFCVIIFWHILITCKPILRASNTFHQLVSN